MKEHLRSLLFVPGNNPAMLQTAGYLGADAIVLDLEDAVALTEKDSARRLIMHALERLTFAASTTIVRVNGLDTEFGVEDLNAVRMTQVSSVLLPKATLERIRRADEILCGTSIELIALLESSLGVEMAFQVATAVPRMRGLFFGAEDYTADMGVPRTTEGSEVAFARARVALAAKAAGIEAIDTPFVHTDDLDGFRRDVLLGRQLGYTGKALVSPRHVMTLHDLLKPNDEEVSYAKRVLEASAQALVRGKRVFGMDGKMIDAPIINRAKRIFALAARDGGG